MKRPRKAGDFTNVLAASEGRQAPIPQSFALSTGRNGREPAIPQPLSESKRAQMHPRAVDNNGEQRDSGGKPTKKLYRGGVCVT